MKKFLLLGAAAMMACAVNAQSITEVWGMTADAAGATANGVRQGTGCNGKIYLAEVGTGMVSEWENGAKTREWNVNQFIIGAGLSYEKEVEGVVSTINYSMWAPIACDDNGNILVNAGGFGDVALATQWVIIPADGSDMQVMTVEYPEAVPAGRVDCAPSKVVGDLLTDAYIPIITNKSTNVIVLNVYADEEAGGVVAFHDASVVIPTALTGGTQDMIAVTADYDFLAEGPSAADLGPKVFQRQRGTAGIYMWDANVSALNTVKNANDVTIGSDGCPETGFAVFTIGETTYYVVPCKTATNTSANKRASSFDVRNAATGEIVATYDSGATNIDNVNGSLAAEVNEDGTATIYVFNQADRIGVYTFDPNGTPSQSGVEETLANDNAPVEYYNLQGVKVANPENGIFVKKQAGKATKVVL